MILRLWPAGPLALLTFVLTAALGNAAPLPVLDDKPLLQVDPGGPSAAVRGMAFSPDGNTLYVGSFDKVVRVWQRRDGRFELVQTFHVPIGPGTGGAINAVAVSDDGKWLAMAGRAPMRGETGFQRTGVILEAAAIAPEKLEDAGAIYVVPIDRPANGKVLRGHRGEVRALAFAPARAGEPQLLVSSATERMGTRRYGGLHLWNVENGKVVAERNDLPERVEPPPGLAVWFTDTKPEEVRVAIAWPQAKGIDKVDLRIWNPKAKLDEAMVVRKADRYTRPLALLTLGSEPRMLAGGLGSGVGRLQVWTLGDKPSDPTTVATFAPTDRIHFVPDALVAVSAKGNGTLDYAAAVLRPTADEDNQLALIDLENKRVVARVPLKKSDRINLPILAAAPKGGFVAVADNADHSVQLFAVADLLRAGAKAEPSQVLRSSGVTARRVAFVDKGRGLWLNDDARAKRLDGGLYFDFEKPLLRANDGAALTADTPALGDWSMDVDDDLRTVRVHHGDKVYEPLVFQKREVVTAIALRPQDATAPAFVAVAYTDRDNARTLIGLYRPEDDGKKARLVPFRLLIAHLQDVKNLTFSKSRPLMASVAEDQTVCVWGLTDLDNAVGQIAGLGLANDAGEAVIHSVDKGSAAAKAGLEVDDVLEAFGAPGGKLQSVKSAADFLLAISARRPGDKIELKIKDKRDPITLTVGRGVEGWKPLFTLFLQRNKDSLGWVGWSPFGPYDASSDGAEACVGWHTNTGNPKTPVDFVPVGAHRKEYYKQRHPGRVLAEEPPTCSRGSWKRFEASQKPPDPALAHRLSGRWPCRRQGRRGPDSHRRAGASGRHQRRLCVDRRAPSEMGRESDRSAANVWTGRRRARGERGTAKHVAMKGLGGGPVRCPVGARRLRSARFPTSRRHRWRHRHSVDEAPLSAACAAACGAGQRQRRGHVGREATGGHGRKGGAGAARVRDAEAQGGRVLRPGGEQQGDGRRQACSNCVRGRDRQVRWSASKRHSRSPRA